MAKFTIDGYSVLELNNVAFRRDGRIEAQCALDATDFASIPAENGMILAVDKVNNVIKLPVDESLPLALHYSTEHMYDERKVGLKEFALEKDTFYPRMGYLSVGDLFTTNCLECGDFASDSAAISALQSCASSAVYGVADSSGRIALTSTAPSDKKLVLKAVKYYTMPDGQPGVKFQVLSV